jgi:phage shock protein E
MKKTFIIIGVVFLVMYVAYRTFRIATLSNGLENKIAKGAIILDVRTAKEFEMGHIEGSVNISLGEIRHRYTVLDSTKTYITVCSHGLRSVKVVSILKERGFKNVYNGGAWNDLEKIVNAQKMLK